MYQFNHPETHQVGIAVTSFVISLNVYYVMVCILFLIIFLANLVDIFFVKN
eukprot:TRINITY_DN3991_c0_g1_i1.p1 TRINITY_DN3991_c0_g1~~TRINITY_DN3991_c0_g1_i1.p1  ORF type:complete len:51 (-),score=1.12 TRINITY_DN3991_c0_g1_i1:51-203(-)